MSEPVSRQSPLARALRALVAAAALAAILGYLGIALLHLRYPEELEWIEGGMIDAVARLTRGEKLYVAPSLDYVPFIYAPLWFHVAAFCSKLFGVGFFAARLPSFLASLAAILLIGAFIHRETKDKTAALMGAGLYAATYPIAASFYDLARVDSLFVALLLGGIYLLRFHPSTAATASAGALFALAFFTKQSAPIVLAPIALHLLLTDRRRGLLFAGVAGSLMALGVLLYNRSSEGWFWHYVFFLPSKHQIVKRFFLDFWLELFLLLGIACALAAAYFAVEEDRDARRFHLFAAAGMFGAALAGRVHLGGWSNVLCPAYAVLGVLFGLGAHRALDRASRMDKRRAAVLVPLVLAGALLQFVIRAYDPRRFLAPAAHAEAWSALRREVQSFRGDVYVSAHGFVGPRVGKPAHAHQMALSDELRGSGTGPIAEGLRREIRKALTERRFAALVIDNPWLPKPALDPSYEKARDIAHQASLGPVIGWQVAQPHTIWVPREAPAQKPAAEAAP